MYVYHEIFDFCLTDSSFQRLSYDYEKKVLFVTDYTQNEIGVFYFSNMSYHVLVKSNLDKPFEILHNPNSRLVHVNWGL